MDTAYITGLLILYYGFFFLFQLKRNWDAVMISGSADINKFLLNVEKNSVLT